MIKSEHVLTVAEYDSIEELNEADAWLVNEARAATQFAYAPYSNFNVGAAGKLVNGETITGSNQENAAYPAGICAERVLLSSIASQHPGIALQTIVVSYNNLKGKSDIPISPCGLCRQSLAEYQQRFQTPIRVVLTGMEGKIFIIEDAAQLLPLGFGASDLKL
jgi:cytidine deaminase